MRPYNTYRNPELSQPVSSVENTLAEKTQNANAPYDILRSLSESISVDCGSFEISSPTDYYQTSSVPSHVAFVDSNGAEFQAPVESVSPTPVNREPAIRESSNTAQNTNMSSVNAVADMDDDNYDCMNDPNYRAQSQKEVSSPSFDELMARTAESIAKMRQETNRVGSQVESGRTDNSLSSRPRSSAHANSEIRTQNQTARTENQELPQRNDNENNAPRSEAQPVVSVDTSKKSFFSKFSWSNMKKKLFSKETFKLVFLSVAISVLIVSAVIYKNSPRNNGLPESEDVVINQTADAIPNAPVQNAKNSGMVANYQFPAPSSGNDDASVIPSPKALTDQIRSDYQSPSFDPEPMEFEYSQNDPETNSNSEDSGRQLASPHSVNNVNHVVNSVPEYPAGPQYADVAPAFGSQYIPDEYASPVLEDDSVSGYSETGYNSNFMR